jgi:lysophospholipase L1-like esterase
VRRFHRALLGVASALPSVAPAVPAGMALILDAANINNADNVGLASQATISPWISRANTSESVTASVPEGSCRFMPAACNGQPVTSWDGARDAMTLPGTTVKYTAFHNTGVFDLVWYGRRDAFRASSILGNATGTSSKGVNVGFDTSGHVKITAWNGTAVIYTLTSTFTLAAGEYAAVEVRGDGANVYLSKNFGAEESAAFTGALATGNSTANALLGGTATLPAESYYNGTLAWLGYRASVFTADERAGLRAFLEDRYGTTPQQDTPIVALGDSQTAGRSTSLVYAAQPWPQKVEFTANARRAIANEGISGETTALGLTRWTTKIRGRFPTLVYGLGGNDATAGTPFATTTANINSVLDQARADGMSIVIMNISPRGSTAGYDATKRQAVLDINAYLLSYATTHSIPYVDVYAALGDPLNSANLNPLYDAGDALHTNQAGSDIRAGLLKPALGL